MFQSDKKSNSLGSILDPNIEINGNIDVSANLVVHGKINGNVTSTFNIPTPSSNRKLEKVIDILGRETKPQTNNPLFYIYDDGTVEKRITIE